VKGSAIGLTIFSCCSVLQCVAVCYSVAVTPRLHRAFAVGVQCSDIGLMWHSFVLQCVAVCCSVAVTPGLHRAVAIGVQCSDINIIWHSLVLQCVALWCSVLQCVAVLDQRSSPQQDMGGCVSSDTTLVAVFGVGTACCSRLQCSSSFVSYQSRDMSCDVVYHM